MKSNSIYLGDCLKLMPKIENKSIDLILCDLPFQKTKAHWDSLIPFEKLWEQYTRVIKDNGCILLFAKAPFDKTLACSNLSWFRYEWIWKKNKASGHLNANRMPMQNHENILVFYGKKCNYYPQKSEGNKPMNAATTKNTSSLFGKAEPSTCDAGTTLRHPTSVLEFNVVNNDSPERIHSSQKPTDLLEFLIKSYTQENELVLDNCMGSASTIIACINTNRHYIGIEKDEVIFNLAKERIENYKKQNIF